MNRILAWIACCRKQYFSEDSLYGLRNELLVFIGGLLLLLLTFCAVLYGANTDTLLHRNMTAAETAVPEEADAALDKADSLRDKTDSTNPFAGTETREAAGASGLSRSRYVPAALPRANLPSIPAGNIPRPALPVIGNRPAPAAAPAPAPQERETAAEKKNDAYTSVISFFQSKDNQTDASKADRITYLSGDDEKK